MKSIIVFIAIISSQISFSQQVTITPEKRERIKAYINHFEENNQLMGTLSIFDHGKEVVNETFGVLNKNSEKSRSERKYTIGSITKLYTAVVCQIVGRRKN